MVDSVLVGWCVGLFDKIALFLTEKQEKKIPATGRPGKHGTKSCRTCPRGWTAGMAGYVDFLAFLSYIISSIKEAQT